MLNKGFFLFFLLISCLSCTRETKPSGSTPVVQLLGDTLTLSEFSTSLTQKISGYDASAAKLPMNVEKAKTEIIDHFILKTVVKSYAKKEGLSVTNSEFYEAFNKIRLGFSSDLEFKSTLAGSHLLIEEWQNELRESLLLKKVVSHISELPEFSTSPTQEELKKYYEDHAKEYQHSQEIRLSQIVVKKAEEAERLYKVLKSGTYSFELLAKKYSLSPDSKKGGDIGYIPKGVIPAFDVAFNFNIGQVSHVIRSPYGYHILKLTGKRPAAKLPFETVRSEIYKAVLEYKKQEAFNKWFNNHVKGIKITKDTTLMKNITVYTQGTIK